MHDYFTFLPVELQERIFAYEVLVPYRLVIDDQKDIHSQGICINNGKSEFRYATNLFTVNKRISRVARSLCFSKNRFILGGDCDASRRWLQSQPKEFLFKIRRLDLLLLPEQLDSRKVNIVQGWEELVASLPYYLDLEHLLLSIDACRIYPIIETYRRCCDYREEEEYVWLKPRYSELMLPFQQHHERLKEIKDFFVFWPKHRFEEAKFEKLVKGEDYDSFASGKMWYGERDYRLIHGWEWSEFDDKGEYDEDYLQWVPDIMWEPGETEEDSFAQEQYEDTRLKYFGHWNLLDLRYAQQGLKRPKI